MAKIKAVCFDLGNVIVKVDEEKLEKEYSETGKVKKGEFVEYFNGSPEMNKYTEGKLSSSQFYTKTKKRFKMNIKFNEFYRAWNDIFSPIKGTELIIRKIKEKYPHIKMLLLSDTNEQHYEFVEKEYGILGLLDEKVLSYKVGRKKPNSTIFKEAIKLSGCLPKEIFYTDDRENYIEKARTLGIRAFTFTESEGLETNLKKFGIELF